MSYVEFSDQFKLGNETIDFQHEKLFILLNDLYDGMKENEGNSELLTEIALDGLLKYTEYHFSEEESRMNEKNYPEKDSHFAAHTAFVSKVKDFKERHDKKEAVVTEELLDFLKDWLVNHIGIVDKKLTTFLNEKH